jgi:hypothetical protein
MNEIEDQVRKAMDEEIERIRKGPLPPLSPVAVAPEVCGGRYDEPGGGISL